VFNAVEGKPVTNAEMTRAIARVLGRPLWLPNVPAFVLKTLLSEMANLVLGGNRVSNEKLLQSGFEYEFTNLEEALRDLLK
jgi:NAD dependent epimerase/dehydratase family enzyme